ncbi:MAG: hypothetical protein WCO11_08075 [Sphingomonadales bacterium]|jgi:hypothetical protein
MIIILLAILNVQFLWLIISRFANEINRSTDNQKSEWNNDQKFNRLESSIDAIHVELKNFRSIYERQSEYIRNINLETKNRSIYLKYIYNLLLLQERDVYDEKQAIELKFHEALEKGDRQELEKIVGMMEGGWQIQKNSIER